MKVKKLLCLLLAVIFILSGLAVSASAVTTETESNDSYASADTLSVNGTMKGSLSSYSDVDYYKITPSSNGTIKLKFKHTYVDKYNGWDVSIIHYANGEYTELSNEYVELKGNEIVLLPSIGAVSSGVYYIKVKDYGNYGKSIGINYSIESSFTSTEYYEKELNNVYSSATPVTVNKTYGGIINSYSDVDYYKITPSSNDIISLKFKHTYVDKYNGWDVSIIHYTNGEYTELSNEYIELKGNEIVSLPSIGAVSSGVYYIKVKDYGNYGHSVGEEYSLVIGNPSVVTEYSLNFNANGGSVSPSSASVTAGNSITLPTPTRSGYTCLGWSTSSTATSASYSCGAKYTPSKNITLYAVWKVNSVPVQVESITLNYKDNYYLGYLDFKPVKYYSDNTNVATVSDSGNIYATGRGRTYVHAVDKNNKECITEVNVEHSWWQWIIEIVLFGWLWY